jgi:hypothetical protein
MPCALRIRSSALTAVARGPRCPSRPDLLDLAGDDVFVSSSPPAWVQLNYNGTLFQVPNWPSVSQGITEVTFE